MTNLYEELALEVNTHSEIRGLLFKSATPVRLQSETLPKAQQNFHRSKLSDVIHLIA